MAKLSPGGSFDGHFTLKPRNFDDYDISFHWYSENSNGELKSAFDGKLNDFHRKCNNRNLLEIEQGLGLRKGTELRNHIKSIAMKETDLFRIADWGVA